MCFAVCGNNNEDEWVVHIGTTGTTRPHTFIENDELTGYDIEVIRKVASQIPGMRLEFTYGTMTELQEALRK
jgi:ABC-type amino acid transport substrate-binding protein